MKQILLISLLLPFFACGQIITTVAGNGTAGYGGNGGPAVAAMINHPIGMAVDLSGNVYFAEYGNNCIRKMDTFGAISTVVGNTIPGYMGDGGPATAAELNQPFGIAVDRVGNLYIGDKGNNCIRKVDNSGIISTIAGTGFPAFSGDGGLATAASLWYPSYILTDSLGNIYFDDAQNARIRKINTAGIISTMAGNGTRGYIGDGLPATDAELSYPSGIWVDAVGNLYIADGGNNAVRKVNTDGIISTIAGTGAPGYTGDGGMATSAEINSPLEVTMDNTGNIYFADNGNNRIRKIAASGIITTFAGNGISGFAGDGLPPNFAEFNGINGLRFNGNGQLFIADVFNSRIRKISNCAISISAHPSNDTVDEGSTAIYSVTTSAVSPVFQWQEDPGTGFVDLANVWPYSGVTSDTLIIHNASMYLNITHYRCVVSNGASCTDTSAGAILIVNSSASVINTNARFEITLYPNPSTQSITITATNKISQIAISNLFSQTLFIRNYNTEQVHIDVSTLPAGIYLIRINGSEVRKFVKQ